MKLFYNRGTTASRSNWGRGGMGVGLGLVLLAIFLRPEAGAETPAGTSAKIKPLFNVAITHPFPDSQQTFAEIMELVLKDYYTSEIDEKTLYWAAVKGILTQLSPPENPNLAAIWTPEEYDKVNATLHGIQESIGIKSTFNPGDGSLTVTEVMAGGPSESLLQVYDRIVRIDGNPLKGLAVQDVDKMLKGEISTTVDLKVVRDAAVFGIQIPRAQVKLPNLEVVELPDKVYLISLVSFSDGITAELREKLKPVLAAKPAGLILDLRSNPGGVLKEGLQVAELFVPEKKFLLRIAAHGDQLQNYVSSNAKPVALPMAILVNKGTASCSEIVAAALRDEAGAVLVGVNTFGKATSEKIYTLKNNYRVKFTINALYSPKGISWQKTGLAMDFPVDQDAALLPQLRKLPPVMRVVKDTQLCVAHRALVRPGWKQP